MVTSNRYAVAVHCLTLLATSGGAPMTSEVIGASVNTNPVVVRRVLGQLRRAQLVASAPGTNGGWRLNRSPDQLSLADAYLAVTDARLLGLHARPPNALCEIGRSIRPCLEGIFDHAEAALVARLDGVSIAAVLRDVEQRSMASAG